MPPVFIFFQRAFRASFIPTLFFVLLQALVPLSPSSNPFLFLLAFALFGLFIIWVFVLPFWVGYRATKEFDYDLFTAGLAGGMALFLAFVSAASAQALFNFVGWQSNFIRLPIHDEPNTAFVLTVFFVLLSIVGGFVGQLERTRVGSAG